MRNNGAHVSTDTSDEGLGGAEINRRLDGHLCDHRAEKARGVSNLLDLGA